VTLVPSSKVISRGEAFSAACVVFGFDALRGVDGIQHHVRKFVRPHSIVCGNKATLEIGGFCLSLSAGAQNMKAKLLTFLAFLVALGNFGGDQTRRASALVVDQATFNADTTGQATGNFNRILNCSGSGCFQAFSPLVHGGILSLELPPSNVTSASFYTPTIYPADFKVPGFPFAGTNTVTISLPSFVTAFGLDFDVIPEPTVAPVSFALSNGFTDPVTSPPGFGSTAFLDFVSTTPF
jgi:hypothetical protein